MYLRRHLVLKNRLEFLIATIDALFLADGLALDIELPKDG